MVYKATGIKKIFHDTRRFLARRHLASKKALQIGITGSQGKTNTTYVITSILEKLGETIVTDTNLDTTFNVPITGLKVKSSTEFLIWELGIDHPGEMAHHLEIAHPKIGVMTGISPVHTDKEHMGSLEQLIYEKRQLVERLPQNGWAVLNWDDINVRGMVPFIKATILTFGTTNDCSVWVDPASVTNALSGTSMVLHDGESQIHISTPLIGIHHIYNIMAGYIVFKLALSQGANLSQEQQELFKQTVATLQPLKGRMSAEIGPRESVFLNDALRANPTSTKFGLQTLVSLQEQGVKKIAVLAEMGEIDKTEEEHTKLGEFIATLPLDYVVCIGPLQKHVYEAALHKGFSTDRIFWVPDVFEAAKVLDPIVQKSDILYMKGSLLRHVERVLLLLEGVKVGCTVVSCPFYHHCPECKYLHSGYQNVAH
jgi:UDP-N-acetylmuramoyl-tripeptide--D-alanyl-D-alanine ligase